MSYTKFLYKHFFNCYKFYKIMEKVNFKDIIIQMKNNLRNKYDVKNEYNKKKINQLIFNYESHYTAIFKEYLLIEDGNDFLKRYYSKNEVRKKLKMILFFYEKYSKIFPNYIIIPESTYMYKNIQKKQKMIDKLHKIRKQELENKKANKLNGTFFTNEAINSICHQIDSFYVKNLKNIIDISVDKENTIEEFNKIIGNIEQNENENIIIKKNPPPYINLNMNKKLKKSHDFSSSLHKNKKIDYNIKSLRQSSISISTSVNSDIINKLNLKNYHSNKSPSIYPIINNLPLNKQLIIHKKGNSQNISFYNSNIKKKILQLDNKNYSINYDLNSQKNSPFSLRGKINRKLKESTGSISSLVNSTKPLFKYNKKNTIKKKFLSTSKGNEINQSDRNKIKKINNMKNFYVNKNILISPKNSQKEVICYNVKKIKIGEERIHFKLNKNIHLFKLKQK